MRHIGTNAYQRIKKETDSPRETEARVLTEGAIKLKQCQENWESKGIRRRLNAALKYNRQIWRIFQSELAKPDNPLPEHLRQDLLSLSIFITKQIHLNMSNPSPEKLNPIININMTLAEGLTMSPDDAKQAN